MRDGRIVRSLALIATASLVLGAFVAGPADAKKKKKKKPKVATCAPYVPGEAGADAPVTLVTDAATADAPATLDVEVGPGLGAGRDPAGEGALVSHAFANLQVDSAASSAPLNVRISWSVPPEDFDIYLDGADGTELASSAGYGPIPGGSEYGSSAVGSESILGYPASDCDGFTVDIVGASTPGATVTVDYWLGE